VSYNLATVTNAIAQHQFDTAWEGQGACRLRADREALFPLSVVHWQIERPDLSYVVMDATLLASPRLAFYAGRIAAVLPILEAAHEAGPLPSAAIPINLDDGPVVRGIAFCSRDPSDVLIPDPVFVRRAGYKQVRDYWTSIPIPWHRRLPVVFWRGGTSGRWPDSDWRSLPRIVLCEMVRTTPLFDVGISHFAQLPDEAKDEVTQRGLHRAYIGEGSFNFYRYHIDIDGNTNSWPGLFIKLLSGGTVLKIGSPYGFRQWYYNRLVPWENYVPVQADMSDLIEKAEWLVANEAKALEIGMNGHKLADAMTYEAEIAIAGAAISRALTVSE
jgi:hypothetical protein